MRSKDELETTGNFLREGIKQCRLLVVGDVMLDQYMYGEVERISPEAPVPVNHLEKQVNVPGGAANVAFNLARLGCQTHIAGVVGDDYRCDILEELLQGEGIDCDGLVKERKDTIAKIRIIGGHQQMLRLDIEETKPISEKTVEAMVGYAQRLFSSGLDGIIISDYKKGVCTSHLCQTLIAYAHCYGLPIFVDPKQRNWEIYSGADFITPNLKELGEAMGQKLHNDDETVCRAAEWLMKKYDLGSVVATRSEKGLSICRKGAAEHLPAVAKDVFDVSGAGDTVLAVLAAGVAGKLPVGLAAHLANIAAGIGVGKVGTYAVSAEELLSEV
ncbi:MAG: D-glycero-beta-D-manno-heptose-7-phosphate kinase [Selenomonas ruminantium]|nr:D-glycero-beta-D-manno-heptose-7-phosphate kinase [Selenomonas ruminantium]